MKTVLTQSVETAAGFIRKGGVVAFPTETVYGLGASAFDDSAVRKVFEAKGRPTDNPLIVHISTQDSVNVLADAIPDFANILIETFFPGPLTLVLTKKSNVSELVSAGLETVAVRMPANETAQELIRLSGFPLVAPSANLSGKPSPTTWQSVFEDMDGRIDCILQSEPTRYGLESTVVDCSGARPKLLRAGAITPEKLQSFCKNIDLSRLDEEQKVKSPGLRHRHYSPTAEVTFGPSVNASTKHAYIGLSETGRVHPKTEICANVEVYGARLFEFFRESDRDNIEHIFCEEIEETGLGRAIMDRIKRAAAE